MFFCVVIVGVCVYIGGKGVFEYGRNCECCCGFGSDIGFFDIEWNIGFVCFVIYVE